MIKNEKSAFVRGRSLMSIFKALGPAVPRCPERWDVLRISVFTSKCGRARSRHRPGDIRLPSNRKGWNRRNSRVQSLKAIFFVWKESFIGSHFVLLWHLEPGQGQIVVEEKWHGVFLNAPQGRVIPGGRLGPVGQVMASFRREREPTGSPTIKGRPHSMLLGGSRKRTALPRIIEERTLLLRLRKNGMIMD